MCGEGERSVKNRVRELRTAAGLTQQQLAELVHVSSRTIISLENGKYNASLQLAHKIAVYFHMNIEEIFLFEEE